MHRGRTEVPLTGDRTRPYIWIWIEPDPNGDCLKNGGKYCWYQYVNLEFFIDGHKKKPKKPIKGATGLYYRFDQWSPDYHVKDVKKSDPAFTPTPMKRKGILRNKLGKPFKKYKISGTSKPVSGSGMGMRIRNSSLLGILDAPDFCNRGQKKKSPIERLLGRFIKIEDKIKQQATIPSPAQIVTVNVRVNARSYLVCIKNGKANCIGYIPWTYTIESRITISWTKQKKTSMGTVPTWKLGSTLGPCQYTLTVNNWVNGC